MKKIFSSAMLLMAGMLAITSCTDDRDSNPTLQYPTEFKINALEYSQTIDLATSDSIPVTWSQPAYTNYGAPVIVNYTVQVSKNGQFTKSYAEAEAEASAAKDDMVYASKYGQDYMALENASTVCNSSIKATELNQIINKLHAGEWKKDDVIPAQDFYVRVIAQPKAVQSLQTLTSQNVISGKALPTWIDLNTKKITYIYVPGNGNGWDVNGCPTLTCENNDDVYTGYAYMDGEFKFTVERAWAAEYNNSSFTTASENIDLGDGSGGNIKYTGDAALCYIKADIVNKTLEVTPVTWYVNGTCNGWAETNPMTYNSTSKCLEATVTFSEDGEFKFERNNWAFEYAGSLDNLQSSGGANIAITAGTYNIQLYLEGNKWTGDGSNKPTVTGKAIAQ